MLIASLLAATAICGVVAYKVIQDLEGDVGGETWGRVLASVPKYAFPNASQWPCVALDGYMEIGNAIVDMSATRTQSMARFVLPEQVEHFERFANQTYREHGGVAC